VHLEDEEGVRKYKVFEICYGALFLMDMILNFIT